jgi:hypothetical protein
MKTLFATFALLAIVGSAHAQFSLTTFDGKTISNKNKPNVGSEALETALYYVWEADFVRIQMVAKVGNAKTVDETLVYYVDTDATMPKLEEIPSPSGSGTAGYGTELKSKKGASMPHYNWREDMYAQDMSDTALLLFTTKPEAKAFFDTLAQKRKTAKAPAKRIVLKKMMKEKK